VLLEEFGYLFFLSDFFKEGKSRHREIGKEEEEEEGVGKQAFVGVPVVFAIGFGRESAKEKESRRQQRRRNDTLRLGFSLLLYGSQLLRKKKISRWIIIM
jgi:hypothetical protein